MLENSVIPTVPTDIQTSAKYRKIFPVFLNFNSRRYVTHLMTP